MTYTTTPAEQLKRDWIAETAAYDWEPDDGPSTLQERVSEAMMLMVADMENGNQDNLGEVNRLNAEIWEEVKPGPGEAPKEYWLMTVEYLGY